LLTTEEIVQEIVAIAKEKYSKDKYLYHEDFKICLYGVYMEVVVGVGDELIKVGKTNALD